MQEATDIFKFGWMDFRYAAFRFAFSGFPLHSHALREKILLHIGRKDSSPPHILDPPKSHSSLYGFVKRHLSVSICCLCLVIPPFPLSLAAVVVSLVLCGPSSIYTPYVL